MPENKEYMNREGLSEYHALITQLISALSAEINAIKTKVDTIQTYIDELNNAGQIFLVAKETSNV